MSGFDLIVVETSGIGQGESAIVPLVDTSVYVMTPEFGAASQLEKIDMLDFADFVAINKFDRKGSEDALRDVRKQYQRNRAIVRADPPNLMPIYGTMASRFNDDGVTALYQAIMPRLQEKGLEARPGRAAAGRGEGFLARPRHRAAGARALPGGNLPQSLREFHQSVGRQARIARERQSLRKFQGFVCGLRAVRPRGSTS